MFFRGIVKKYTVDLILLTKYKKIIGLKEKFKQNIEVPVSCMEFYSKPKKALMDFLFDILHFMMVFRGIGLLKLFPLIFS